MNELSLVAITDFCRNFPTHPKRFLEREHLHEHIDRIFADVTSFIFIEGEPLTGKSQLLAGYMRRNPKDSLGIFLSPGDAYFYTPEFVRLVISEQIHWLIHQKPAPFDAADPVVFTRLIHQLQRLAKRAPITFVIDGL